MTLTLSVIIVICTTIYFDLVQGKYLTEGVFIGLLWFSMCILIDLPIYLYGPMQMSLKDYAADIGLTYVMIPTITIGFGVVLQRFHLSRK